MPTEAEQTDKQTDQDYDKENMDDKVYCVCRSQYEEGKAMIACDRYVLPCTQRVILIDNPAFKM
jgi:hypothetical protein